MALRLKKDIKKASYYVWFLGAQESRGLRGDDVALAAIQHLERRARDLDPFKVTLQVSHKGLKIIQNVAPKGKQQTIKHFIPHGSITSAAVRGDVVACVLLLYNPVTGCPIHVHAYRCDSDRTAEMLCTHLQALIDRPENQKKFADIERKLQVKGALPKKAPDSSLGSEASARESESGSSEERCVANLYDSLAAELKQKLSTGKSPILLPPRDYDTVHRQKGNLSGIDTRRCLNQNIVGVNARRKLESSGGSSGIGSDLAPSPDQEYPRQHDNQSTSEEDWAESTAYMMHEAYDPSPPRRTLSPPRRTLSPRREPFHEPPASFRDPAVIYRDPPAGYREPKEYQKEVFREPKDPYREPKDMFREPKDPYREPKDPYRDQKEYREQVKSYHEASYREQPSFDRRYRHDSLEQIDKVEKYVEEQPYRRRYVAEPAKINRSMDRIDERPRKDERAEERPRREERVRDVYAPKMQRGASEGSLKLADASPKDRFNVAKEKFKNLERERFNRELEQQMAIRRSMLERNGRSPSIERPDVRREEERPRHIEERSRRDDFERQPSMERPRREDFDRQRPTQLSRRDFDGDDIPRREVERLPRVGRKVLPDITHKRFENDENFDKFDKRYRDRDRRVEEDEVIEPVIEERSRNWQDRQRAFSRSRLVEEQRASYVDRPYYERDYRELAERQPTKFRHSYAEPIPRGRLGVAAIRPY